MRLYLSSFDLGHRPEELVALAGSGRRASIIGNALDNQPQARAFCQKSQTEKLIGLGFVVAELDLRDYFAAEDRLQAVLQSVDLVWINGGNTFILRRAMKQSGFDSLIKDMLSRDELVYAGFSAGAVVTAGSLRGLEFIDDPHDAPQGYDPQVVWDGLGLLPFALAVHFASDHSESALVEEEIAFYRRSGVAYRTLRDGEALVVDGERQEIVGSRSDTG